MSARQRPYSRQVIGSSSFHEVLVREQNDLIGKKMDLTAAADPEGFWCCVA
jgi:hypothetical protein